MTKDKKNKPSAKKEDAKEIRMICRNRKASFEYEILDSVECGIVLTGTEVKSLRGGKASLEDAYARIENSEVWLHKADIPEYAMGNRMNHEPKRKRKLLLRKQEIRKFAMRADERGFTLVPLRFYFKGDYAKVEMALAKGKQEHDKRETLKKKDADREMKKIMNSRNARNR